MINRVDQEMFEMEPLTHLQAVELYVLLWQQIAPYITEQSINEGKITADPVFLKIFQQLATYLQEHLSPSGAEALAAELEVFNAEKVNLNLTVWNFLIKRYSWTR